ncbi:diacylglycerol kinase [Aliamphritea spongicola]|uniref:diacylglycerol kinase n=1 Tax=Aliamphritea spongicola TaxID=707589 RepID=UPI00196AAB95|nr:diacylglycerol kinase [Aliamphritea spongicola]MBN3564848.1 diacylglycerol kinase [Aliamphritea spongicola]
MKPSENSGIRRFYYATKYSIQGFRAAYKEEQAFRYELAAMLLLVPAAVWIAQSGVQLALLWGSCLLVLAFEIVNSAIEAVVDRWGSEYHELAGRAKDMGSAGVFLMIILTVVVWGGVLYDNGVFG